MSFPSNFILLNTIIILENPKKINDEYINNFLNQYEKIFILVKEQL